MWRVGRRHQFREVRETGKGRSLEVGLANWSLGETSSVWKNRIELTVTADVLSLPAALVAQAVLTKAECMQLSKEQC